MPLPILCSDSEERERERERVFRNVRTKENVPSSLKLVRVSVCVCFERVSECFNVSKTLRRLTRK